MVSDLSHADVRELLDYDSESGVLTNRISRPQAPVGAVAGFVDYQGYRAIKVRGRKYLSGRIIWFWMTGKWPECEIDHANLIRDDDRWCNLREATRSQNCANKGQFYKTNSLGYRGVKQNSKNTYAATICVGQKEIYLGRFSSLQLAALAYDVAAKKHHGAFARFNFPEKMHRDWIIP